MTSIKVEFSVSYVDCNLSANEAHPQLHVYLSNHVRRDYTKDMAHLHLDPNQPEKAIGGQITGYVSGRQQHVPATTSVCFASYAWITNDAGVQCKADTGVADVPLVDILNARPSRSQRFVRDVPLVMHTVGNVTKGTIRFAVHALDMGHVQIQAPLVGASAMIEQELQRYYKALETQRKRLGDSIPGTERIDAPYNFSESGFSSPAGPMPLIGYMLHELPRVNTAMFRNALDIVMRRDGMRTTDWHLLNEDGRERATINMLMLIPTYCDYLGDTVQTDSRKSMPDTHDIKHESAAEKFGAPIGEAGDCEDFAEQIVQMHEAFNRHELPQNTAQDAPLRDMQRISRQLISYTTLAIVNGQQINQQAHVGAHMYALFEGWRNWKERLELTPEGRTISKQLPYPDGVDQMPYRTLCMGEGTGIHEALGYSTDLVDIMGAVNSLPSLASFKKFIWRPRGQSVPFYIGSVLGVTGYFARRGSVYGTWNMTSGPGGKRGVLIEDMISGNNERFGMAMHPRLSKRILGMVQEAAAKREPVPPMVLDPINNDAAEKHAELDRVVATVASWNRPQAQKRHVAIPVYVRPYQVTKKVANQMISDFQRAKHICKVTKHLERITNDIYGYRVMIHVNVDDKIKT